MHSHNAYRANTLSAYSNYAILCLCTHGLMHGLSAGSPVVTISVFGRGLGSPAGDRDLRTSLVLL